MALGGNLFSNKKLCDLFSKHLTVISSSAALGNNHLNHKCHVTMDICLSSLLAQGLNFAKANEKHFERSSLKCVKDQ